MGSKSEIKLLGTAASPFANRVQFALNLKSIEYEYIEENLACKSELLLKSNPVHKKVPVLLHADKPPICESQIIIEYLDEIRPDLYQLLPSVSLDRANCRFWATYIDTKFFPLYEELRQTLNKTGQEAIKKQMIEVTQQLEEAFIKSSNGKTYFGGDQVGYLDVILGCFIRWTKHVDELNDFNTFDEVRTPELAKWAKCIASHEALKSVTPGKETLESLYGLLNVYRPPYK
ncbi:glutathione S-transferase U17-like [Bidens hawaiensis]|uniref:glutathione S-transferase U17-like n=1 Tax=Bidens hawaiensis TaxID=980011 RepID=UPI00404992E3